MESEIDYFQRRASEERQCGLMTPIAPARQAHLTMAEHLESLARAIQATQRRRAFYDVNAPRDE